MQHERPILLLEDGVDEDAPDVEDGDTTSGKWSFGTQPPSHSAGPDHPIDVTEFSPYPLS